MTMSPWSALRIGLARVALHKRLVLWLYLCNVAFAGVLLFPFRNVIGEIGKSDLSDDFVSGFSLDSFIDFLNRHALSFKTLGYAALGLGVVYLLLSIFLTAGIVAALACDQRVSMRRFLTGAGRTFGRFVRLFVFFLLVMGLLGAAYSFGLAPRIDAWREAATTDRSAFLRQALGVVLLIVAGSLTMMVFDYAKIRAVVDRRRGMFRTLLAAFAFCLRRSLQVVPLFYLNVLMVGVLFGAYLLLEGFFSNATTLSLWSLFVLQQLFVVGRVVAKLSFFSSQLSYYRGVGVPADSLSVPVPIAEPEPMPLAPTTASR